MNDREVIEICAKIVGIESDWRIDGVPIRSNGPDEQNIMRTVLFNPLESANDAWKVLEAVRKMGHPDFADFMELLDNEIFPRQNNDELKMRPGYKFCWIGQPSDIARAAAKAWGKR